MSEYQKNLLERKSIKELPNEILLTIFSYLQTYDVKYNIPNVCVRWSILAKNKRLWKYLNFKTTNKSTKTFGVGSWYSSLGFLLRTPELQNLTISQGHSVDEVVEILAILNTSCPNLRHIEFEMDFASVAKYLRDLNGVLEKVESLKVSLDSSHTHKSVLKILTDFKNLKEITFVGANPESLGFRNVLNNCPFLEHVNVVGVTFSMMNFVSLWKNMNKWVRLGLKSDKLDEVSLEQLATFPNLKSLVLSDGNSSPGKLCKLGKLNFLNSLHLQEAASSPVLTSTALTDFFKGGSFSNLKELKLHQSRLNDEGAAEIRRNCTNLIYLEVMTYPRSLSSLSERALMHFLHCRRLQHFEILFDNSEEADWIYRRKRHFRHDCDIDDICPIGLENLLDCWDEIQIPVV